MYKKVMNQYQIDENDPNEMGKKLRYHRVDNGYTTREFCNLIHMRTSTLWQIETGKVDPKLSTILKICKALGVSMDSLNDGSLLPNRPPGMKAHIKRTARICKDFISRCIILDEDEE